MTLSVIITTFNNARTLPYCLESVKWADEIVVLDSFSTDDTLKIAEQYGCRTLQHMFMGYGRQKQMALEHATHPWVLLLDADEALSPEAQQEVRELLEGVPACDGYTIPRLEQQFWRMCHPKVRINRFLRLFQREKTHFSEMPVHAAPQVQGRIGKLSAVFYHFGDTDIHLKVARVNSYSSGLVRDKLGKRQGGERWRMVLYPPFFFIRSFIFKRNCLNGWAGFITSVSGAFYVFLKYAKLYEYRQFQKYGTSLLPPGAPVPPMLDKERDQPPV